MNANIISDIFTRAALRSCAKHDIKVSQIIDPSIVKTKTVTVSDIAKSLSGSRATRYRQARKIYDQIKEVSNG